jgi:hypothetical protein
MVVPILEELEVMFCVIAPAIVHVPLLQISQATCLPVPNIEGHYEVAVVDQMAYDAR